jgi:hypothetical protein
MRPHQSTLARRLRTPQGRGARPVQADRPSPGPAPQGASHRPVTEGRCSLGGQGLTARGERAVRSWRHGSPSAPFSWKLASPRREQVSTVRHMPTSLLVLAAREQRGGADRGLASSSSGRRILLVDPEVKPAPLAWRHLLPDPSEDWRGGRRGSRPPAMRPPERAPPPAAPGRSEGSAGGRDSRCSHRTSPPSEQFLMAPLRIALSRPSP